MKKNMIYLVVVLLLGCTVTASAQDNSGEKTRRVSKEKAMERKTNNLLKELALDDTQTAQFRDVYTNFLTELNEATQKLAEIQDLPSPEERAKGERPEMTDEQAEALMIYSFEREQKVLNIKVKYYTEFRKFLNPKQVMRIYMNERPKAGRGGMAQGQRPGQGRGDRGPRDGGRGGNGGFGDGISKR